MSDDRIVYRKSPDIVVRHVAGETLLIPIRRKLSDMDRIYTINATGEAIWDLLDGQRTIGDIARCVAERYDVADAVARADVAELLAQLHQDALVERVS